MTVTPKTPQDLLQVDPKDRGLYGHFSLAHLTAYSVHWLSLWQIPTTYENVSVLNARLFPADFAMAGFPNFPDAFRTNRTLLQMRPKYRGFATSDPRRGVYLTERGKAEVEKVISKISTPTTDGKAIAVASPEADPRRRGSMKGRTFNPAELIQEKKSKLLFRRFREGKLPEADVVHLLGLLGLYDHSPPLEVRREFRRLRDAATSVGDREFLEFLDSVHAKFRSYLERHA